MNIPPQPASNLRLKEGEDMIINVPPKISQYSVPPPIAVPGSTLVKTRAHGRRLPLRLLAVAGVSVVLVLAFYAMTGPSRSIRNLLSAMERRDRETVAQYVDADRLAPSMHRAAMELYEREKQPSDDDILSKLLDPIGDQIVDGLVKSTITPESIISSMCGESAEKTITEGCGRATDALVDNVASMLPSETQVQGKIGKVLFRLGGAYLVKQASADANQRTVKPENIVYSVRFESASRFIVIGADSSGKTPTFAGVFERHGLATWKLSEIRLLPLQHNQNEPVYAAK